jgi:hypothetical protein
LNKYKLETHLKKEDILFSNPKKTPTNLGMNIVGNNFALQAHQILSLKANDRLTELLINSMRYNSGGVLLREYG